MFSSEMEDSEARTDSASQGSRIDFRLLISSRVAGAVIGKGGQKIKKLRETYQATVSLPDSLGAERIVKIAASKENVLNILSEIIPTIQNQDESSDQNEVNILVHSSTVGAIIGRGGSTIKTLREENGTNVKVFPDCLPESTERNVRIQGPPENIVKTVSAILDILDDVPPKGVICLYDPSMVDPGMGYGGFDMGRGGMRGGGGGGRGRGGGRGGMGGMRGGGMMGGSGMSRGGGSGGGGMGPGRGFSTQQGMYDESHQGTSTQVTIPKDLTGALIGKGGSRIKQIRSRSGAGINIDEALPGSNDRVITITGTQEQINYAQFLMQESVRSFSGTDVQ